MIYFAELDVRTSGISDGTSEKNGFVLADGGDGVSESGFGVVPTKTFIFLHLNPSEIITVPLKI